MHRTGFIENVAEAIDTPAPTIKRIGVELTQAGILSSYGKGISASDLKPKDAATIIAGFMASDKIKAAPNATVNTLGLRDQNGQTLFKALTKALSELEYAGKIDQITVFRSHAEALIQFNDGRESLHFLPPGGYKTDEYEDTRPPLKVSVALPGWLIAQLSIWLKPDYSGVQLDPSN